MNRVLPMLPKRIGNMGRGNMMKDWCLASYHGSRPLALAYHRISLMQRPRLH